MSGPLEIERKFLVPALPDLSGAKKAHLRQGYVTRPEDSIEIRLRQSDESFVLSAKSGEGMVRREREVDLSAEQFEALWPETEGRRIEKIRWTGLLEDGSRFELDVYAGDLAPLLTVEVEFPSETLAKSFAPPAWFGAEVTMDKRFRNKALAIAGGDLVRGMFG